MSPEAKSLLHLLITSRESGAFAVACDGPDRAPAHELEVLGLAEWKGTSFGSSFYAAISKDYANAHPTD